VLLLAAWVAGLPGCATQHTNCEGTARDRAQLVYWNLVAKQSGMRVHLPVQDQPIPRVFREGSHSRAQDVIQYQRDNSAASFAAHVSAAARAARIALSEAEFACRMNLPSAEERRAISELLQMGAALPGTLGIARASETRNVGVLLPPTSRVFCNFTMWPRDGVFDGLSANEVRRYSWGQKGNVQLVLDGWTMDCQIAGAYFTLAPFTAAGAPNVRMAQVIDASFRLALPGKGDVHLELAQDPAGNTLTVNGDDTGVFSVAMQVSSRSEQWDRYLELFRTVRVQIPFVHRTGALDFEMPGPQPSLGIFPTQLAVPLDGDICPSLAAGGLITPPEDELSVKQFFSKPPGMPWTKGQLEALRLLCDALGR
jgi:hypothetical protein